MIGNVWVDNRIQKDMEELFGIIVTYMATTTDDEYEEIAQSIRHDLVYSQYRKEIETLSDISRIRLTATAWNKDFRSVSI